VGFPGESDADFAHTRTLIDELPFTYLHVFAYSDRKGTEAARLRGHLEPHVVAARSRELRALARAKNLAFRRSLAGTGQEVFVLETRDHQSGALVGLTGNYVEVVFAGPDSLMRQLARVRISGVDGDRTLGVLE
ncbi:MAG: tRNA (N(6)-L-threonylcarbamoyladenosine(37)-C(2))-methylthiotransferase MtaB, partial [Candidatus Rokuibacteriota bacterium]